MKRSHSTRQEMFSCILSVGFLLFCELFFFRNVILTDGLLGDRGDGRLTMLIAEHWFHVFQGRSAVADLGIFYPAVNTLAYSDMLLGYGLIHSLFRSLGMDVFYAYKATLIFVHLLGTFSTFWLLKRTLRVDFTWALFGTTAFSFSNTYAIHLYHTQLAAISLLPLATIFALAFFRHLKDRAKRNLYAVSSILTLVLLLYTSWYMAFFTALFTATVVILTLCTTEKKKILSASKNFLTIPGADWIFYLLLSVSLVVPFLLFCLPVFKMSGGFGGYGFLPYGPELLDIINVSTDNWLLGSLMRKLWLDSRGYSFEVMEGFNIVLLFAFIVLAYRVYRQNAKQGVRRCSLYRALVFAIVIGILLVVRLSASGISLWLFVYYLFPGGKAIRAVARYFFFLSLPMSVVTAMMGDCLAKARRPSIRGKFMMGTLLLLTFVANIHIGGVSSAWNRGESLEFIDKITPPPGDCKVFYIVNPPKNTPAWATHLDAYQIADRFGINTINGYSGIFPRKWGSIWRVDGDKEEYEKAVSEWIELNGLENVYAYDEMHNTWGKFSATE